MAKKRAVKKVVKQPQVQEDEVIGRIEILIHPDGTFTLNTEVSPNPIYLSIYANMMVDIGEGKLNADIIKKFSASEDQTDQQIAQFLSMFIRQVKNQDKPLVAPNKVFRRNKMK